MKRIRECKAKPSRVRVWIYMIQRGSLLVDFSFGVPSNKKKSSSPTITRCFFLFSVSKASKQASNFKTKQLHHG